MARGWTPSVVPHPWRKKVSTLSPNPKFYDDDFKQGTNGIDALGACVECGACSEEKFMESDELNGLKTGQIIYFFQYLRTDSLNFPCSKFNNVKYC